MVPFKSVISTLAAGTALWFTVAACKTMQSQESANLNSDASDSFGLKAEVRGEYNQVTFTAIVRDKSNARVDWDDGAASLYLVYEPNPIMVPRCPCSVYSGRDEKGNIVELAVGYTTDREGKKKLAESGTLQVILPKMATGSYEGSDFEVAIYEGHHASLSTKDRSLGLYLLSDKNPPLPPLPLQDFAVFTHADVDGKIWQLSIPYVTSGTKKVLGKEATLKKVMSGPAKKVEVKGLWKGQYEYSASILAGQYAEISWLSSGHGEENIKLIFDLNPPTSSRGIARSYFTYRGEDGYIRILAVSLDGKSSLFLKVNPTTLKEDE